MKRARTFDDIERQVLAAVFLWPRALELADDLELDDFGAVEHQAIFAALRDVQAKGQPITVDSVCERMIAREKLKLFGCGDRVNEAVPFAAVGALVANAPTYGKDNERLEDELLRHLRELRVLADQRRAIRSVS